MKDNVMHMVPMTDVKINEGERVFKKGGDHVMLFDVAEKPAVGSKHTMTLYFSDNTKASCEAVVKTVQDVMKDAILTRKMPPRSMMTNIWTVTASIDLIAVF